MVVHSAQYRVYSKNPVLSDQVCVNWRKSNLPAWEKAMLEFALAISRAHDVTDDYFKKLEMHDFNQEDAWNIAVISAFFCHVQLPCSFCQSGSQQRFLFDGQNQ